MNKTQNNRSQCTAGSKHMQLLHNSKAERSKPDFFFDRSLLSATKGMFVATFVLHTMNVLAIIKDHTKLDLITTLKR